MTGESLYPRDLIERLRGRLDEIERWSTSGEHYCDCRDLGCQNDEVREVAALGVQAHRKILDRHAPRLVIGGYVCPTCADDKGLGAPCADVRDLASIYFPESDGESP